MTSKYAGLATTIEQRVRYAVNILTYSIMRNNGLHYSDVWAVMFLRVLRRTESEEVPLLAVDSYPVICHYCGKQIGTNNRYADVRGPQYPEDCCYKLSRSAPNLQPLHFTVFDYMPVVDMVSYYMDVPAYIVQHYATLEAINYFNQREKRINELSRYATNKHTVAGFSCISSLS